MAERVHWGCVSLSAVMPAYNEEAGIRAAVLQMEQALAALTPDFEIVVADDGSRDGTGEVLRDLQAQRPDLPLRVVTHAVNQGYGAAVASGLDAATKDLIFFTDADQQFDVREVRLLLAALDGAADMAIGYRKHRADPPLRLLNAQGWKLLVNGLFGHTARDVDCAFKLFRREVWRSVTVHSRGATFSAEFLVKARRLGFAVREVGVSHYPRRTGSATGPRPTVIVRAFADLVRLWLHLKSELAADPRALRASLIALSEKPPSYPTGASER